MKTIKITDVRQLKLGDTVAVVAFDHWNKSSNDPGGWWSGVCKVVSLVGPYLGERSVEIKWEKQKENDLGMDVHSEGGQLLECPGHGSDGELDVYLLHRKGELNDEQDENEGDAEEMAVDWRQEQNEEIANLQAKLNELRKQLD